MKGVLEVIDAMVFEGSVDARKRMRQDAVERMADLVASMTPPLDARVETALPALAQAGMPGVQVVLPAIAGGYRVESDGAMCVIEPVVGANGLLAPTEAQGGDEVKQLVAEVWSWLCVAITDPPSQVVLDGLAKRAAELGIDLE